jgi:endonuclease YncB( thermonuclease family)
MKRRHSLILAFLITGLIACNYILLTSFAVNSNAKETALVARVIDGDTLVLADSRIVRLLNINTPEKSEPSSKLATDFMKQFENQSVELEITGTDKYKRNLARIYSHEGNYLNLELVQLGLAVKFLVSDTELSQFAEAEEKAIDGELGIWSKSQFYGCLSADIDARNELIILSSSCPQLNIAGWRARDESRKYYIFPSLILNEEDEIIIHSKIGENNETDIFWNSKTDIWNNDRDTLYIFDKDGKIALASPYGY